MLYNGIENVFFFYDLREPRTYLVWMTPQIPVAAGKA